MSSDTKLPRWGERLKAATLIGGGAWGSLTVLIWAFTLVEFAVDWQAPSLLRAIIAIPAATGFAVFVIAGVGWLVAEFATGLREPRQSD